LSLAFELITRIRLGTQRAARDANASDEAERL
jgi:hypothetical protein